MFKSEWTSKGFADEPVDAKSREELSRQGVYPCSARGVSLGCKAEGAEVNGSRRCFTPISCVGSFLSSG